MTNKIYYSLGIFTIICLIDQLIIKTKWFFPISDFWLWVAIPLLVVTFIIGSLVNYWLEERAYKNFIKEYHGDLRKEK